MKKRSFTLVELLVVIAIISILAGMLFPALTSALETARKGACRGVISGIGKLCQAYATDHDGKNPISKNGVDQAERYGLLIFSNQAPDQKSFMCPASGFEPQNTDRKAVITSVDVSTGGNNPTYRYDQKLRDLVDYSLSNKKIPRMMQSIAAIAADGFRGDNANGMEEGHNHYQYGSALYTDGHVEAKDGKVWYEKSNGKQALTDKDTGIKLM